MKSLNPRIERLKELMELEGRRADLQEQLDQMASQMNKLKDSLFEDGPAVPRASSASPQAAAAAPGPRRGGRRGRTPRGALKEQIVSALSAAGSAGVRVVDLAKSLGINPVNVHSWFHSAIRRFPEIKKVDRGQYRLTGTIAGSSQKAAAEASPASTATAAPRGRGGRRSSSSSKAPHSRRGELSSRILSELTSAGARGVTVRELAEKVGAPYKNIYIWFATTGKKNPKVKKLAPATYKLSA